MRSFAFALFTASCALAQNASISGLVKDPSEAVVPNATVTVMNKETGARRTSVTNVQGSYSVVSVNAGRYQILVAASGFQTASRDNVVLEVAQNARLDIVLQVGTSEQSVTVTAGDEPNLASADGSVSTVINQRFIENLPLNGRSFQSLFGITPGLVTTAATTAEMGQFSVNGQRADTNYFLVDGASANIGTTSTFGSSLGQVSAGSLPGLSAQGGTNNLVSVDALQEFRIQTSSYAPEFGRTPGAQISLVTKSGTNQPHGSLFDYLRNDKLDARDWFANQQGLKKPALRQNDFGGVAGGPIVRDKTFFFASYEGLRLRQPQTLITDVPSLAARQQAPAAVQAFLNAYPIPNGPAGINQLATFAASYADRSELDAASLRIDHTVNRRLTMFGRYNYAPSQAVQRAPNVGALSNIGTNDILTQTFTAGATILISPRALSDTRVNWSGNHLTNSVAADTLGGARPVPVDVLFPAGRTLENSIYQFNLNGNNTAWRDGNSQVANQRHVNLIENLAWTLATHQLKGGVDYRRVFPVLSLAEYVRTTTFAGGGGATGGISVTDVVQNSGPARYPIFHNYSAYLQDTWKAASRITLTYGVRWDYNPPPRENSGHPPVTVTGLDNPATITLAPPGTPLWHPGVANFAPRAGISYALRRSAGTGTILRGGTGIFYDLGNGPAGLVFNNSIPYGGSITYRGAAFPLTAAQSALPAANSGLPFTSRINSFDPNLSLPYSLQWNVAIEQEAGQGRAITASYVGAAGRHLLRLDGIVTPNPNFTQINVARANGSSNYNALQLQFQQRLHRGLQIASSYTWSHSIDTNSNDTSTFAPLTTGIGPQSDRGSSDFDLRHTLNLMGTYNLPGPGRNGVVAKLTGGWALDTIFRARSSTPLSPFSAQVFGVGNFALRPNLNFGVPVYLYGAGYPGGKRLNPAAFTIIKTAQGSLGRNVLRGFGANQVDFALRRQFGLTERIKLQLRAEFFNLLNHPNFGDPVTTLTSAQFGLSNLTLGRSLGGLNPLYQIGGPRSGQVALKVTF